jgi:hypothetical protein
LGLPVISLYAIIISSTRATRPTHLIFFLFYQHSNIWWRLKVMKHFITQFSAASCYFPTFRSTYLFIMSSNIF